MDCYETAQPQQIVSFLVMYMHGKLVFHSTLLIPGSSTILFLRDHDSLVCGAKPNKSQHITFVQIQTFHEYWQSFYRGGVVSTQHLCNNKNMTEMKCPQFGFEVSFNTISTQQILCVIIIVFTFCQRQQQCFLHLSVQWWWFHKRPHSFTHQTFLTLLTPPLHGHDVNHDQRSSLGWFFRW